MRSSPWYHQRRSESAPPVERPRDPPTVSQKEQEEITERISRPTESALYRKSLYWKLDSFMERGFHSWSKMDLFEDCKRCMWTQDGTVKGSCKIRPLQTSGCGIPNVHLPPLPATERSSRSKSRTEKASMRSSSRGNDNGVQTARMSWGGTTNGGKSMRQTSLSNGLAMLGNVSGARYKLHNRPTAALSMGGQNRCQYPASVTSLAVPRAAPAAVVS